MNWLCRRQFIFVEGKGRLRLPGPPPPPHCICLGILYDNNLIMCLSGAVLYYYFYKRTALRLGDPRFYQDSEWIRREFEKRR